MVINEALKTLSFGVKFKRTYSKQDQKVSQSSINSADQVTTVQRSKRKLTAVDATDEQSTEVGVEESKPRALQLTSSITVTSATIDENSEPAMKKIRRTQILCVKDAKKSIREKRVAQIQDIRHRHKIYVWGSDVAPPCETFDAMLKKCKPSVKTTLMQNIDKFGFTRPTPIQMQAIPQMLQRREILACAPTGSGKTLAFVLPLVCNLCRKDAQVDKKIRALIVQPTRELAHQTFHVIRRLCENLPLKVHMATKFNSSKKRLEKENAKHYDILISTPKRIVGMVRKKKIDLSAIHWLIVDESDKLFESGPGNMRDQLAVIYKACDNTKLRRAFFSATFSFEVEDWCKLNLDNVVTVCVGKRNSTVETVEQELKFVGDEYGKVVALKDIFRRGLEPPILIFVQTKERAEQLFNELLAESVRVNLIHSGKSPEQRNDAIAKFRSGETFVLICTELLGRGIDFKCVNVVVNYDFPQSPISYIHRIGRTGRAGRLGRAITLFTESDKILLRSIANVMKTAGCDIPDYMLHVPKPDKNLKRKLARRGVKRKSINLTTKDSKLKSRNKIRRRKNRKNTQGAVDSEVESSAKKLSDTAKKSVIGKPLHKLKSKLMER